MPPKKQKSVPSPDDHSAGSLKFATQPRSRRITRSTASVPSSLPEVDPPQKSSASFNATSSHRDEEAGKERRVMGASLMTNVLALADTLGVKKGFHVDADQLLFLDTVRVMAVLPDVAVVPAKDVYEKILSGIQETKSLRVTVASFRLLHDLDLRHPQVNLKRNGTEKTEVYEFVDNKEQVWSPFEYATKKAENTKPSTKVSMDLYLLLENIANDLDGVQISKKRIAFGNDFAARNEDPLNRLVQFLMLRWLVSLLGADFQIRQQAFQGNPEKVELVQESLILRFLMRQDNLKIKELLTNLLRIITWTSKLDDSEVGNIKGQTMGVSRGGSESDDAARGTPSVYSSPASFVTEADFAHMAATLLSMILELEDFKALSDNKFAVSRNAVSIGSLVETLMGILQYAPAYLCPLLQTLENPPLKFKLILKYFVTHAPGNTKDELREISTAKKLFDCVSKVNLHKSFYPHELQVLLAGAFQVFLETHVSHDVLLREVCRSFQVAFTNLNAKLSSKDMHHTARCALVMAHTLIHS